MNTPVSFEISKLLKEKGFDIQTLNIYQDGEILLLKSSISNSQFMTSRSYSAPTIAEVVMWLYEKHGIWVYVDSHEFGKWCYYYRYNRPHELSSKITENGQFGLDDCNSPTEAYEAAIDYTLNNLI